MTRSLLEDAFAHHVWATLQLLDTCRQLDDGQLEMAVEGTFGSIIDTMRHLVAADSSYLFVLTGGLVPPLDAAGMSIPELRAVMERNGDAWASLPTQDLVCTVLTMMGIEPPAIDVWDFAEHDGRLVEIPPTS